ncbi:MAG: hypothetical protein U5K27_08485 [Desulfotignum sp.]|nr:hypothetical protein [Desulfotignum sp.]
MKPIPINGIRLGPGLIWTGQDAARTSPFFSVCQALSIQRINLVCAGLHRQEGHDVFSGCVESRYLQVLDQLAQEDATVLPPAEVTQISVYPHRRRLAVPAVVMEMLESADIPWYHLVSSPAVMCVIIDARFQDRVIALLETFFDLPGSHTPYFQEIDQDISALLKKYPETRSTYVEEKIKTYGIQLHPGVSMVEFRGPSDRFSQTRHRLTADGGSDAMFHLVSVMRISGRMVDAVFVMDSGGTERVDLITFHGPHFGDRYRILQTALNCLETERAPLRAAACAGASISLVFPAGAGEAAQTALAKGFEAP